MRPSASMTFAGLLAGCYSPDAGTMALCLHSSLAPEIKECLGRSIVALSSSIVVCWDREPLYKDQGT